MIACILSAMLCLPTFFGICCKSLCCLFLGLLEQLRWNASNDTWLHSLQSLYKLFRLLPEGLASLQAPWFFGCFGGRWRRFSALQYLDHTAANFVRGWSLMLTITKFLCWIFLVRLFSRRETFVLSPRTIPILYNPSLLFNSVSFAVFIPFLKAALGLHLLSLLRALFWSHFLICRWRVLLLG